ncbi:MAG: transcription termination/antitermination factor NusG, partial [Actinomycetales bacterium]
MSEEQLAAVEAVDTDIELEEEVVQEEVSPEVAAFREELRSKPGEWFVVHSYAGFEKRVKGN